VSYKAIQRTVPMGRSPQDRRRRETGAYASEAAFRRLVEGAGSSPVNSVLEEVLRSHLTKEELREFFRISYEVNRKADPKTTLRGLSRSTRVVGEMLQVISDGSGSGTQASRLARTLRTVVLGTGRGRRPA
jgi:hypothetical protein